MRKALVLVCVMVIVMMFMGAASADAAYRIGMGVNEFTVFGSISNMSPSTGDSIKTTIVAAGYNRFVTNDISAGANIETVTASSGGNKAEMTFIEINGKYHFIRKGEPLVPYAGLYLGRVSMKAGDVSESGTEFKPAVGLKYFVSDNTSVNAELSYSRASIGGETTNTTALNFGLSVYF